MPSATRRLARATHLVKLYIQHQRFYKCRLARRKAFLERHSRAASPQPLFTSSPTGTLSSLSSSSDTASDASAQNANQSNSDSENWLETSNSELSSIFESDAMDLDAPLRSEESNSEDSDGDSEWGGWDSIAGMSGGSDGDDEDSDGEDTTMPVRSHLQAFVHGELEGMYTNRYEAPRDQHPRGPSFMQFTLDKYKTLRADLFRQDLRVTPETFDRIVDRISDHPIFFNNSTCPQAPVKDQLAITLFCFGHYGNAASLERVRKWAGTSKGLVKLATRRVMTALLSPEFMKDAVRLPTDEEKEEAKEWVEEHSCKAWRDGWCLVDGTLIPLYARPYWYGESYFDRKCNYSLNIQVSLLYSRSMCL